MKIRTLTMMMLMAALTLGVAAGASALVGDVVDDVVGILDRGDPATAVPEPSAALVFGTGLLTAAVVRRLRRR